MAVIEKANDGKDPHEEPLYTVKWECKFIQSHVEAV